MPEPTWAPAAPTSPGGDHPVSILLAGKVNDNRLLTWQSTIMMDARFRLTAVANNPADLQAKLASSPEVIFLDALVFDGPSLLVQSLTAMTAAVYVVLPFEVGNADDPKIRELPEVLKKITSVKGVFIGDMSLPDLTNRAYADALMLRKTIAAPNAWAAGRGGTAAVSGMRIITVWNRTGGGGRTTIAAALAQSVARRGTRTLLVGLDAPDVMPLHLGLKSEPNILSWFANPTDAGIKAAIQSSGPLDCIAGFPDVMSEAQGEVGDDEKNSIAKMVIAASYIGYAGIILDTPVGGVAPRAISAANTWVLVARPTIADAWASVEAFRQVVQRAAGQHRINPGNIFVLLNMRNQGMLSPNEWHEAADAACRKLGLQVGFPPVAVVIPHIPGLSQAQDGGRPVIDSSDEFARPIHTLADMLFGGTSAAAGAGFAKPESKKPGMISFKIGKGK
jgi:arsenite-transporting ATPase